jgi:hypothetical protein
MKTSSAFGVVAARGAPLVVCALLAGCGGIQGGSAGRAPAPPSAALGNTQRLAPHAAVIKGATRAPRRRPLETPAARASGPITIAAADAFAHAVNLTASDVPGASAHRRESHGESRRERRQAKQAIAKCLGVEHAHEIADVRSPELERGAGIEHEWLTSSVTVFAHAAEVEREFVNFKRPRGRACLARRLQGLVRARYGGGLGRAHLGPVRITWLHPTVPGAVVSAGLRVAITIVTARGATVALYVDQCGFALGSAEVEFTASSYVQPLASSVEQQLLSLLLARAYAHEL